ncbi:hypothetical protein F4780DRAFT_50133 [Xylariomycetidae sp. FL0641]|nr:hypothetical protein F4780DRAFT_50133 [Xylariomycetidae sp. FL0641]
MVPIRTAASRSTDADADATSYSDITAVESRASPSRSLKKRFTDTWARKRIVGDEDQDQKGPVGLRLLRYAPEPLIDMVFVHGLRGGSIKTWRKGSDPRNFWPQLWLPLEREFRNVNIHSFGYDSDWASTKSSILNVHDFGQSLLEEMRNSPYLRENRKGPIILVGHSMGGLVIKKAFILSKDVPDLDGRIRCIFFLATPHRGSDYASILNNILTVSGVLSPRQYVADLITGSTSAQLINEDFGKHAHDLPIFSFYETLRMSPGLIVAKHSAVLGPGFRKERVQYIDANHRDICKFESPDDPGYQRLKNAMGGATADILRDLLHGKLTESKEKMQALRSFLGVTDRPNEHHALAEGSCQWIDELEAFQDWRDSSEGLPRDEKPEQELKPSIFWIYANPGTGKTFLAAHIIDELSQFGMECAYYFFHVGNKMSRSIGGFLRSMAFQMALSNSAVRDKLTELHEEGSTFDQDDARTIWNKIFLKGIFQARVYTPQYWVIDALDECNKYHELFTMLKGLQPAFPLRIFITSRKVSDMQKMQNSLEASANVTCKEILPEDVVNDLEFYVHDRASNLPFGKLSETKDLVSSLLRRANACFLWVRLVLDELETVYSDESIVQVLDSIPEGMVPYYERTIRDMSENKHEKHIAKAILLWIVASSRSMTIDELSQALELDIGAKLGNAQNAVEGLCGQLVTVDKVSGLVELVHPTVREFLLSESAGEFHVPKAYAHQRIAMTCLKLLSSGEMQPPRSRRQLARQAERTLSELVQYAVAQFSEHVYTASTEEDALLLALNHFLSTNILTWIETIAKTGDLHPLIRVSKNLKGYLVRRAKYKSPISGQVRDVEAWATDLSRVATKFGRTLLQSPSSVYYLIPPLCPTESAIHRQVSNRLDGLTIVGHRDAVWDDCIAAVNFDDGNTAAALSCGERLIAVGLESGDITLFDVRSCQKEAVIAQKHPIDLIHFADSSIVISTTRTLVAMDRTGLPRWQKKLRFRCILLTSTASTVVAVSQHGHVLKWSLADGTLLEDRGFGYERPENEIEDAPSIKAPDVASISPDMELLALGYRWGTVCLWEIQTNELVSSVRDSDGNSVPVLLFNPNPSVNLLLVVKKQIELALYETFNGTLVKRQKTSSAAGIISVACSPDGRTLASTDTHGTMQIWDFESLNLLYQVTTPASSFRMLQFASDGSSIIDMLDSGMRIWTPAILVRRNVEDDQSVSDDAPNLAAVEGGYEASRTERVTALCAHPSLPVSFVGKRHGQVIAFDSKAGTEIAVLYEHAHQALIKQLAISDSNIIASADVNGVVQLWSLVATPASKIWAQSLILEASFNAQIQQLCFSPTGQYLLIATTAADTVYSTRDKARIGTRNFEPNQRKAWRWMPLAGSTPDAREQFALLNGGRISCYDAKDFPSVSGQTIDIAVDCSLGSGVEAVDVDAAFLCPERRTLVVDIHYMSGFEKLSTMIFFDLQGVGSISPSTSPPRVNRGAERYFKHFVAYMGRTRMVLFLDEDSWLCSADLEMLQKGHYNRHFLVPGGYLSMAEYVTPAQQADDSLVFCVHGDLTVVKNGLNFRETKDFRAKQDESHL